MRLKTTIRFFIIAFAASTSIYFMETARKANNANFKQVKILAQNVEASNTDFMLFQSVSKYLFISFSK